MKKNVKLIATMVAAVMLVMSLASIGASAAETDKFYTTVDISSAATGKFWVDPTSEYDITRANYDTKAVAQGGYRDFISSVGGFSVPKAAVYPMQFKKVSNYDPAKAWIMSDASLRSPSGVPYILPVKTATAAQKEAIVLSEATWSANQSVSIQRNIKKVHFVVASAGKMTTSKNTGVKAVINYTDKENYAPEEQAYVIGEYSAALVKTEANALCYIESYESKGGLFVKNGDWGGEIVLREYSINVTNPDAQVANITFKQNGTNSGAFAIIAVTTEDVSGTQRAVPAASAPALADGSYSVVASTPVAGKAVLAIYDKEDNSLVAVKFADIVAGNQTQKITAESEKIVAEKEYAAKIMILDGLDKLVPLTGAFSIE